MSTTTTETPTVDSVIDGNADTGTDEKRKKKRGRPKGSKSKKKREEELEQQAAEMMSDILQRVGPEVLNCPFEVMYNWRSYQWGEDTAKFWKLTEEELKRNKELGKAFMKLLEKVLGVNNAMLIMFMVGYGSSFGSRLIQDAKISKIASDIVEIEIEPNRNDNWPEGDGENDDTEEPGII